MEILPKNPHPGELLKTEFLDELGISAYRLSKKIGVSRALIRKVIRGKTRVSADLALRLSIYFGNSPEFWLDYQKAFDLREAERNNPLKYVVIKVYELRRIPDECVGKYK
jgi:addiction module HigA family antidote